MAVSRIGAADESDYADRDDLLAAIGAGRGFTPNIFQTMLLSPDLTAGWVALANAVRLSSTLDVRTRELVILLVAHLHHSTYEWGHHAGVALRIGITQDEIDRLERWPSEGWDDHERAVLTFAAAAATHDEVPQGCLDALLETSGRRFVVDLAVTVSYYAAVGYFTAALAVEPESADRAERQSADRRPG